jgi:hypothetical protein
VVEEVQEKGSPVKLHLLGDTKQMQAISAGDFLKQVQELGVAQEVEYAHLTEILRQRDPGLLEIARGLNREDRTPGVAVEPGVDKWISRCGNEKLSTSQHPVPSPSLYPRIDGGGTTEAMAFRSRIRICVFRI